MRAVTSGASVVKSDNRDGDSGALTKTAKGFAVSLFRRINGSEKARARNRSGDFLVEVPQLPKKEAPVSILWIVLIVVLVLALLGFVGRGF